MMCLLPDVLAARLRLECAAFSETRKDIALHAFATDGNSQQPPYRSNFATGYNYFQRVQHRKDGCSGECHTQLHWRLVL